MFFTLCPQHASSNEPAPTSQSPASLQDRFVATGTRRVFYAACVNCPGQKFPYKSREHPSKNKKTRYSFLVQSIFQISDVERPHPSFLSSHFFHTLCVRLDVERSAHSLFITRVHLPTAKSKAQTHNAFLLVSDYRYRIHRPLRFYHTLSTIPTMEASWEPGPTTSKPTTCRSTSLIVCRSASSICHPHYELI